MIQASLIDRSVYMARSKHGRNLRGSYMNFGVRIRSQPVVFDRLDRKNWRPITLLNVDYKLCARTLAGRLLRVIHNAVEKDQTCGAPGRYIGENVSLLRDLVDYTSETDTPAAILSLDQEKAFDRVDWNFMFNTLSRIGFGPSFIRWVRLLYTDFRSCVLLNSYSTPVFYHSRGVRQGCPLSPLLYVLTIEVLAANLRSHPSIITS